MNQPRQDSLSENNTGNILSEADKKKFKNYHLPLFPCPSCGELGKGNMINLMGSPCVSCGYSINAEEFKALSFSQYKKQKFAFHLDVEEKKHQEIIQRFQKNVLWECDQCGKHNLNLPKLANGEPDFEAEVQCEGCAHPYEEESDVLPFWVLKQFGFDDGDDSSNVYELKKLGETQLLWLQALAKARKIDAHTGTKKYEERKKLIAGLEDVKSQSRLISGGKWRDGTRALAFLDAYLFGTPTSLSNQTQREIQEYARSVIATNNPREKTPYRDGSNILQKYIFNLLHLDTATMFWTGVGSTLTIIAALGIIEKTSSIALEQVTHQAQIQREDKGILNLEYTLYRDEPYYDGDIEHNRVFDSTGVNKYKAYERERDFYRLQENTLPTTRNNGYETLDTGEDRPVWVSQSCPDTSSSDDSWGGSGGSYSPSGGSDGMGFGGSGDMFYKPEHNTILDFPNQDITLNTPSIQETIGNISQGIFNTLIASPAYAESCGYWSSEDITVRAEKFITVQEYQVWDWKTQNWYSSTFVPGVDYASTFQNLQNRSLTDHKNQRIIAKKLLLQVQIQQQDGTLLTLPVENESEWIQLSQNLGTHCEISKSYLESWIYGIESNDILEQCKIQ